MASWVAFEDGAFSAKLLYMVGSMLHHQEPELQQEEHRFRNQADRSLILPVARCGTWAVFNSRVCFLAYEMNITEPLLELLLGFLFCAVPTVRQVLVVESQNLTPTTEPWPSSTCVGGQPSKAVRSMGTRQPGSEPSSWLPVQAAMGRMLQVFWSQDT